MEYGRYRILNQLGQGGMATVYLAEDPLLQRLVAIKVIQAHLSSNSNLMDRFTVEAKTIASLRHVNIVEVFDFGIQDDQQFLVMEYIDGQNLQAICAALQGRPMANTVAAAIICQAAEGLTSAEKHGVVHRDIKPENLMFNSEGQLKIADFGIAHIADEGSRTQTGAVLGSPNFMSPEQIEGLKPTNMTDIFSLGGVFYYCLTAKMPFTGPSIPVTMRNICERPHPPILDINPQADPHLVQLVDALLRKAPEHRGEGARWLANHLRTYLNAYGVVDVVEHVKLFVNSLGIVGGGQTIVEGAHGTKNRPTRGGGSSLGNFPASSIIKGGGTMNGNNTYSRSLADASEFQTQATTGAMGPSSRSPVVWIGALLS
ncbi:MAG: serine/threonine-protein kinase, partial [Fibrobacteria bacterium]